MADHGVQFCHFTKEDCFWLYGTDSAVHGKTRNTSDIATSPYNEIPVGRYRVSQVYTYDHAGNYSYVRDPEVSALFPPGKDYLAISP